MTGVFSVRRSFGRPLRPISSGPIPSRTTPRSTSYNSLEISQDSRRNYHSVKMDESVKKASPEAAKASSPLADFKRPLSGLFAINKPSGLISMTLLESLKELFQSSKLFVENPEPFQLQQTGPVKKSRKNKYWQKKNQAKAIKIGQGGTLDPLASGVLIIGLNSATKKLSNFLDCSKVYRTTGILGCKTDSYDSDGKTIGLSSWKHVKPEDIHKECALIKGEHWQIPPIYSALKMDGKPLYEYARNNIPLPRPIEARRCEVFDIKMVDWKEGGEHPYQWPTKMMSEEESQIFQRAESLIKETGVVKSDKLAKSKEIQKGSEAFNEPTKREASLDQQEQSDSKKIKLEEENNSKKIKPDDANDSETIKPEQGNDSKTMKPEDGSSGAKNAQNSSAGQESTNSVNLEEKEKSPAFTLEMTVSSGTYVRSIVHDIGQAVSSAATVVSLIRTRQGDFCLDPQASRSVATPAGDPKSFPCIEWSVFENAIQSRSNGSDEPVDESGLREWERELLKHIQV
ncbi:hypothetical protein PtA15_5A822 [Puccinia triticina]|uniref:tRNA pseudouridine(55) synthase n=1 Tax=Puccinia triticina TaxID=208348 RepID=A0ABY7CK19_9BASI|nr:uncharacterized protein PtA15_5A822 [Puccinia triticina]WAQ85248.1 hypothetical protein PtA15_5A822 [Puccinia triticina]WAR58569.1 hypothetical protein PtB15_5B803 [Puccinia triticina]